MTTKEGYRDAYIRQTWIKSNNYLSLKIIYKLATEIRAVIVFLSCTNVHESTLFKFHSQDLISNIHTYIHKLYLSSDFSVAYKLVSPILITNFKSYSKNKAKKRKK